MGSDLLTLVMAGATAGREKRKLTPVEQDLLPIEEPVDAGRKSTVGREEWLLELVVCWCSPLVQRLARRVLLSITSMEARQSMAAMLEPYGSCAWRNCIAGGRKKKLHHMTFAAAAKFWGKLLCFCSCLWLEPWGLWVLLLRCSW